MRALVLAFAVLTTLTASDFAAACEHLKPNGQPCITVGAQRRVGNAYYLPVSNGCGMTIRFSAIGRDGKKYGGYVEPGEKEITCWQGDTKGCGGFKNTVEYCDRNESSNSSNSGQGSQGGVGRSHSGRGSGTSAGRGSVPDSDEQHTRWNNGLTSCYTSNRTCSDSCYQAAIRAARGAGYAFLNDRNDRYTACTERSCEPQLQTCLSRNNAAYPGHN
jgi:hypothetical protein